jgi:hypothetical protein
MACLFIMADFNCIFNQGLLLSNILGKQNLFRF